MIDTMYFEKRLEDELARLEGALAEVGERNPGNPADWVATPENLNNLPADRNEVADTMENLGENSAILNDLENEYNAVKDALARIANGTYGTCGVCGKEIPVERLEALPAASACLEHASSDEK